MILKINTMYKGIGLTFASGSLVGLGCKLVQFVVYCVVCHGVN